MCSSKCYGNKSSGRGGTGGEVKDTERRGGTVINGIGDVIAFGTLVVFAVHFR